MSGRGSWWGHDCAKNTWLNLDSELFLTQFQPSIFHVPWRATISCWKRTTCFLRTLHIESFGPISAWNPASSQWPFDHLNGGHLTPEKGHLTHPKRSLGRTWMLKLVLDTGAYYGTWNIHGTTNSPLGAWLNNEVLMDPWRKANLRYTLIYRMC